MEKPNNEAGSDTAVPNNAEGTDSRGNTKPADGSNAESHDS